MLHSNIIKGVIKRGGTAALVADHVGRECVVGELNGYDIHCYPGNGKPSNSYFTVRKIAQRGYHDWTADYNSGGHTFCNRISDLDWACR